MGPCSEERQGYRRGIGFREPAAEKRAYVIEIAAPRQIGQAAEGDERNLIGVRDVGEGSCFHVEGLTLQDVLATA